MCHYSVLSSLLFFPQLILPLTFLFILLTILVSCTHSLSSPVFYFSSPLLVYAVCLSSLSHARLCSSSSAADCCPSYLCSRLGMFFLLMTGILSLTPSSLPVFLSGLSHLPMFPMCLLPPTHLRRVIVGSGWGLGGGWRPGRAMIG